MTLYLDTSSLVKQYIDEGDSQTIRNLVSDATVVATSVVTYTEARAVFARWRRERLTTAAACAMAIRRFDLDWTSMLIIDVTEAVARSAGALADRLNLRGFDAIQLACFEVLLARAEDEDVRFSSANVRLSNAAKKLG